MVSYLQVENISKAFGENVLFENISFSLHKDEKVALIAKNGSGKTTLLQLLLKKLEPTRGTVTHGTKLEVAYFDQHRAQIDPKLSVMENGRSVGPKRTS